MRAIILAAGFGTRLHPITKALPKALLPLGDGVLMDHLLENLTKVKPTSVLIITNNLFYEQFVVWRSKQAFPFPVDVMNNGVNRNEDRKGAVLDLYHGLSQRTYKSDSSLILTSDNYFDFPLSHFLLQGLHHLPNPVIGTYNVRSTDEARKFGVVTTDERHIVTSFVEKPERPESAAINVGAYLLPAGAHETVYDYLRTDPSRTDRIGDFIGWLSKNQDALAVQFEGIWTDIGDLESYSKILAHVSTIRKEMVTHQ